MIFHLLISLLYCSFSSQSTPNLSEAIIQVKDLFSISESLENDFNLLNNFYDLLDSLPENEKLYYALHSATWRFHSLVEKLYEKDSKKFILEVAGSNPFLLGFYFFLTSQNDDYTPKFFLNAMKDKTNQELASISFNYTNDFIWNELKKPINDVSEWNNRLEIVKTHLGILQKVQQFYYPSDKVVMKSNGKASMQGVIQKFTFLMEEFKLIGTRIDISAFEDTFKKLESLSFELNGKFNPEIAGSLMDLFRLCANHFMIKPLNSLTRIPPRMICLSVISHPHRSNEDNHLFSLFTLKTSALIQRALNFLYQFNSTELIEEEQWHAKMRSRLECLKMEKTTRKLKN